MELVLTFAIGRLIYTLIDRFYWKPIVLELVLTSIFIGLSVLLLCIANLEIRALTLGGTFIVTGLATRIFDAAAPVEARGKKVAVGIIDVVWIGIMGAALTIVCFVRNAPPVSQSIPSSGYAHEYYIKQFEATQFILGWVINSVPILGATVAACMAILWAGELWAKPDLDALKEYRASNTAAIKIVVAFFVVVFAFLYWVGVPLYYKLSVLTEFLKS